MATINFYIVVKTFLRILFATFCTVVCMIGVGYLINFFGFNQALIIPASIITGICGFVIGVYWTMTYLVKSGYTAKK